MVESSKWIRPDNGINLVTRERKKPFNVDVGYECFLSMYSFSWSIFLYSCGLFVIIIVFLMSSLCITNGPEIFVLFLWLGIHLNVKTKQHKFSSMHRYANRVNRTAASFSNITKMIECVLWNWAPSYLAIVAIYFNFNFIFTWTFVLISFFLYFSSSLNIKFLIHKN